MKPSISFITLGVADYERSKAFYEALGWTTTLDVEETAFLQANGVILVLWGRDKLSADMQIPDDGATWSGIALAHNVASRAEVNEIIGDARRLGATITKEPGETFYGGYAGMFRDPDGHAWEISFNPGFELLPDGSMSLRRDQVP